MKTVSFWNLNRAEHRASITCCWENLDKRNYLDVCWKSIAMVNITRVVPLNLALVGYELWSFGQCSFDYFVRHSKCRKMPLNFFFALSKFKITEDSNKTVNCLRWCESELTLKSVNCSSRNGNVSLIFVALGRDDSKLFYWTKAKSSMN